MSVVRTSTPIAVAPHVAFDVARDVTAVRAAGLALRPPGVTRGLLDAGDRLCPSAGVELRVVECTRPRALVVAAAHGRWRYRQDFLPDGGGTLVVDELTWRGLPTRSRALRALGARAAHIRLGCLRALPLVVGAAVLDGARVLAAQRTEPSHLAGYWELPGGKVEPGESAQAALRRECREELGIEVALGPRVGADVPLKTAVLQVWSAVSVSGRPRALEHAELRWLAADELGTVDWLPADRDLLPSLRALLDPR